MTSAAEWRRRLEVGGDLARPTARSPRHRIRGFVWHTIGTYLALLVAFAVLDGLSASSPWDVLGAAVLLGIVGAVLDPVLAGLAVALGWFGVALVAVLSQAVVVYVTLEVSPGIHVRDFWTAFLTSCVVAVVSQVVGWAAGVDDETAFVAEVVRRSMRAPVTPVDPEQSGVVFVQMDGVSEPLLDWALTAGNLPTLNRWVRSGSHVARGWTTRLPSTTPISQAGILHGRTVDMPAFRWFEKDLGRLIVANHPPDAALIESRLSDGHGLLADEGVSVSNLFSGDAARSLLTMSSIGARRAKGSKKGNGSKEGEDAKDGTAARESVAARATGRPRDFVAFVVTPQGFGRSVVRTFGEMVKEVYQARRQVRHHVVPRVPRDGAYILLRGFTNVLQRDLNVVLVAEAMMSGAKSVYVDFLDYDEIAHHAGLGRPESLAAVQGIDRAIGHLEAVARHTPRHYEFVILSDHGQSQGSTFLQRYGERLEDVVRRLMGGADDVVSATGSDEDWGPLNAYLSSLGTGTVRLGPSGDAADSVETTSELVVAGSGNLGLVWFPQQDGRVTLERAEELWPGLVRALALHPGVSFVMVQTRSDGPVVLGAEGVHRLATGEVDGVDPLAPFEAHVAHDLVRLSGYRNAADIYVNSLFDPESGEVAAFEELVGCHGGAGGWQTKPMLVHPAAWTADDELLGAEAVHAQLVRWLEDLGHRRSLAAPLSREGRPHADRP